MQTIAGGSSPLAAADETEAARLGLTTARVTTLLSSVFHGDANQLANIRAVTNRYPLRGSLTVADEPFAAGVTTRSVPASGEAWAESRLAADEANLLFLCLVYLLVPALLCALLLALRRGRKSRGV